MDEKGFQSLKGDAFLISNMIPEILAQDIPYIKRVGKNVLEGKKLDNRYQEKISKILLSSSIKMIPIFYHDSCEGFRPSMENSLKKMIGIINSIETNDPIAYEKSHLMPLDTDNMQKLVRDAAYNSRDVFDIMQNCRPGAALSTLKTSFQSTFENMYLPCHKYIKDMISSDNLKYDSYRLTEEILCYERVVYHDNKPKSDIREIRNLLEHDPNREGDSYRVHFQDNTELVITEDELVTLTITTGLRSFLLANFCNLFMILRMYELSCQLKER